MKAIKDPVLEKYGMCYSTRFTDEFEKLVKAAQDKIEPFSTREISRWTYYFEVKNEEVSGEFDCCDDEKCVKQTKVDIRKQYGKGTHVKEVYYDNDGDHESINLCCQCAKPLNEWLTWCHMELEYLEENEPWDAQFLIGDAFTINCILQSCPTMDESISEYAKHQQGDILKKAIESREQFFQRIGKLAETIINTDLTTQTI